MDWIWIWTSRCEVIILDCDPYFVDYQNFSAMVNDRDKYEPVFVFYFKCLQGSETRLNAYKMQPMQIG